MKPQPLDYQSPPPPRPRKSILRNIAYVLVTRVVYLAAYLAAFVAFFFVTRWLRNIG